MNKLNCRYCLKPMGNSLSTEIVNGIKIPAHKHCIKKFAPVSELDEVKE